jgi:predicted ATPase
MLTRLKVSGFKNLVDVDIRFGPFTCIAGANGVGKSNLFDAIRFLSALAERPLVEAALSVRDEESKSGDVRSLFHRIGNDFEKEMSFEAEMIIPETATDELGQTAKATITFLRYTLKLAYRANDNIRSLGSIEILEEKLEHINRGEAHIHLLFPMKVSTWRDSVLMGRRTSPFISTEVKDGGRFIKLHQDGGSSGRPLSRPAEKLPRTVLSSTNAAETPTALIAKQEMRSWRLLQLEPSALRKPDKYTAPISLAADGSHLASTLYHLALHPRYSGDQSTSADPDKVYAQIANRLSELIEDVGKVWVDRDDSRELLTLMVTSRDGTTHPARSLSDGTMRFLALSVLELDLKAEGVICLEEPENGIHPERIPKILELLQDVATDAEEKVGEDNPLRQVIINTHSPAVVQQVPEDSLVVAELRDTVQQGKHFKRVSFGYLPDTWRGKDKDLTHSSDKNIIPLGRLLSYLNPVPKANEMEESSRSQKRVIDRRDIKDLTPMIPGLPEQLSGPSTNYLMTSPKSLKLLNSPSHSQ